MPVGERYRPAPRLLDLSDGFFDPVAPARFPLRTLRFRNQRAADRVGLGGLDAAEWEQHFARFAPLPANLPEPLAMRYHGHQFMVYNPRLGDGRGFVFAELLDDAGRLLDLGTKGSGRTPWSRDGDGRLTLKGGFREVLATEMLEALGVPTSQSFSLFETGEALERGDEPSPTRSSVLVRLSHSHIRFGSFQRLAFADDEQRLSELSEFSIANLIPLREGEQTVAGLLREVARRAGELAASYTVAGFVHGVLNTDNMNITGESFDYGPYRFAPSYDPSFVAAYFDHSGLYSFGNQPRAILWNLMRFAEALAPLAPSLDATPALEEYRVTYREALGRRLLLRLGLAPSGAEADAALADACFAFLAESQVGFDRFFFDWRGGEASAPRALAGPAAAWYRGAEVTALRFAMSSHAATVETAPAAEYFAGPGPCSLLIDELEAIWSAIASRDDWRPFDEKIAAIRKMGAALAPRS